MSPQSVVIAGTGGHAQVLYDAYQLLAGPKPTLIGWLEHEHYTGESHVLGLPVFFSSKVALSAGATGFYMGIGMVKSSPSRWQIFTDIDQAGLEPLSLIHPSAWVSPLAQIEAGCYIGAKSIIQPFAKLQQAAIINTGAIIEHHVEVGRNSHVAPGAIVCGQANIGEHTLIGAGSTLIQGVTVGKGVTIGAGSVVTQSILQPGVYAGVPVRQISESKREKVMS